MEEASGVYASYRAWEEKYNALERKPAQERTKEENDRMERAGNMMENLSKAYASMMTIVAETVTRPESKRASDRQFVKWHKSPKNSEAGESTRPSLLRQLLAWANGGKLKEC